MFANGPKIKTVKDMKEEMLSIASDLNGMQVCLDFYKFQAIYGR